MRALRMIWKRTCSAEVSAPWGKKKAETHIASIPPVLSHVPKNSKRSIRSVNHEPSGLSEMKDLPAEPCMTEIYLHLVARMAD